MDGDAEGLPGEAHLRKTRDAERKQKVSLVDLCACILVRISVEGGAAAVTVGHGGGVTGPCQTPTNRQFFRHRSEQQTAAATTAATINHNS